jgi:hypothetical protein
MNNPSDVEKMIIITLNLAVVFSFALVKWGSSSAWIGTHFLAHIQKP